MIEIKSKPLPPGLRRRIKSKDEEDYGFILLDDNKDSGNKDDNTRHDNDEITKVHYEGYIGFYVEEGTAEDEIEDHVQDEAFYVLWDVIEDFDMLGLRSDDFQFLMRLNLSEKRVLHRMEENMAWGDFLYQRLTKFIQLTGEKKNDSCVYHHKSEKDTDHEEEDEDYGDEKHGDRAPEVPEVREVHCEVYYDIYSDLYLGDDGEEINEFGIDLKNVVVGPEMIYVYGAKSK